VLCLSALCISGCQTEMDTATAEMEPPTEVAQTPRPKPMSHFERGLAYEQRGQFGPAMNEYRLAIRDDPKDSRPYVNLGRLYEREQQFGRAERHWQQAIEVNPNDARAYNLLGRAYKRQGEFNKAIAYFNRSLEANPNRADVHWNLAVCYRSLDQKRQAVRHYRRYIALASPRDTVDISTAKRYLMTTAEE